MKKVKRSHKLGKSHKAKALISRNLKAQGLPVNVIIIAAIALIVLVVLIAIFTGRFGMFTGGIKEVANCDNGCKALGYNKGGEELAGCAEDLYFKLPGYTSENPNSPFCCCKK